MYEIYFYRDKNGNEPVLEYIRKLSQQKSKDSRIKLNKINDYIQILSKYGIQVGEPYIKHLDADIWELRPLRDRIFFASYFNQEAPSIEPDTTEIQTTSLKQQLNIVKRGYILLHYYTKKTQKTPKKEIEQAKREFNNLMEESDL